MARHYTGKKIWSTNAYHAALLIIGTLVIAAVYAIAPPKARPQYNTPALVCPDTMVSRPIFPSKPWLGSRMECPGVPTT